MSRSTAGLILTAVISLSGYNAVWAQADSSDNKPIEQPELRFPAGAKQSGQCQASFDVNPQGETENIQILSCTDNIYEWPSEAALRRFKYSPKPTWRRGLKTKLTFQLKNEFGIEVAEPKPIDPSVTPEFIAEVELYNTTRKASKSRKRESEYCCFDYAVSDLGSAYNVYARKCSSEDAEILHGSGFDIRGWEFQPALKNSIAVSSRGYSDILWYRKNGRLVYRGTDEDKAEYCPAP